MNSSTARYRNGLLHLFVFFLFLVVPLIAFVRPPGEHLFQLTRPFVQNTVANTLLYGFFYLNYYLYIPQFFYTKKYVIYIALSAATLFLLLSIPHLAGSNLMDQGMIQKSELERLEEANFSIPKQKSGWLFAFDEVRRHLFSIFSAVFLSLLFKAREHVAQLHEEKLQAELLLLKNQINPHFLFNAMNSVYSLSLTGSEKTAKAIHELSEILRYSMKTANESSISLRNEIEYINNYLAFQEIRLGDTAKIEHTISIEREQLKIAPMILISFIENCFKHGINNDANSNPIRISIEEKEGLLTLTTFNNKYTTRSVISGGIGVNNTLQRLAHLYPNSHTLKIEDNAAYFQLQLTLKLAS
ncbi:MULTISPECIES: sensor histidine kinase [unclassified Paraflavitalea]|uniref:sensor histidine kinase n=1 Tax=unclassified Paraflavitalea TaxID=2798305 RepID=UPI003D3556D8